MAESQVPEAAEECTMGIHNEHHVVYASTAMRFRWVLTTSDSVYLFIIGILALVAVLAAAAVLVRQLMLAARFWEMSVSDSTRFRGATAQRECRYGWTPVARSENSMSVPPCVTVVITSRTPVSLLGS